MALAAPARNRVTQPCGEHLAPHSLSSNAMPHGLRDHLRSGSIPVRRASQDYRRKNNNVRADFGQRCRGFRKLLIAKSKAVDDDLQVLSLNEAQALELVKKHHVPAFPSSAWPAIWSSRGLCARSPAPAAMSPASALGSKSMANASIVGAICSGRSGFEDGDLDTARTSGVLKCRRLRRWGEGWVRKECETPLPQARTA